MSVTDDSFALIMTGTRRIGTIVPDVVIREVAKDEMVITDHPVERGAAISDHAFIRPVEIEMNLGWSDSSGGYVGYARDMYEQLLALMKQREPFDVSSGKRNYRNMLVASIAQITDQKSENAVLLTCRLREIIIASTQTTGAPSQYQKSPQQTSSTADRGSVQLKTGPGGRVVGGV